MKKKNSFAAVDIVFIVVICALIYIKSFSFYSHLSLASFPPVFAAATSGIFLLIFTLCSLVSIKGAKTTVMVIYTVISVFMAVDSVYYSYASKLPSAALLSMAWQIGGVSDTVLELIKPRHVMLIFDLPFWLIFRINREDLKTKFPSVSEKLSSVILKSQKLFYIPSCAVICAVGVLIALFPDFEPEYMANELFCYHISDFYETLSDFTSDYTVDKAEYTSPDYSENEYYGIAENRNVFIIQVEAMQNFVIGAEYEGQVITPNLNAMIGEDTIYFDNYYYQIGGGNTADAEFAVNNSLFAPQSEAAYVKYADNDYHGLPFLLKDNGYSGAHVFHGYTESFWNRKYAYVNQGFDDFTALEELEQTDMFPMGLSDREMFRQSLELIKTYEEPFYAFYITVSS
ncbi:MAG: LTA synthase family protein, partial [Eubacteriales bacterium]